MESIVKEYIRNNQMKNQQLGQDNTTKKKKPLTYNEIKKVIASMSDFNSTTSSTKANDEATIPVPKAKGKNKKSLKKYNFEII